MQPKYPHRDGDLPREELIKNADDAVQMYRRVGVEAEVSFKFTCEHCGKRLTLVEPNKLPERGECYVCGNEMEITHGGFMLAIHSKKGGTSEP